jgi:alcohol dehydrogenase class IV
VNISTRLKDLGVLEKDLKKIAFYASKDVVNIATNPSPISQDQILKVLKECYQ